jgi:hypothetical protein
VCVRGGRKGEGVSASAVPNTFRIGFLRPIVFLRIRSSGFPSQSIDKLSQRFRSLAVALHPDKCSLEKASEAFHRVNEAYKNLLRYAV